MADKMMRVAGRDGEGKARALKVSAKGNIQTEMADGLLGKNLIDIENLSPGYVTATGDVQWDASWRTTAFIPIVMGASLVASNTASTAYGGIAFYDSGDALISWISNASIVDAKGIITVPPLATRLRASNQVNTLKTWQIEYGTTATSYEPYKANMYRQLQDIVGSSKKIENGITNLTPDSNQDLEYKEMDYYVIAANEYHTYGVDSGRKLYRSPNGGDTWTPTGWTFAHDTTKGIALDFPTAATTEGVILVFSNGGVLKSSDSGVSFASVLTDIKSPLIHGMFSYGNTVIFGEYSVASGTNTVNLWRSADGGSTWTAVLTLNDVTHFHTVVFFPRVGWYATTGDSPEGSRFYHSVNGIEWKEVARGTQYRTVGLSRTSVDVLIWASDSDDRGIFAAKHNFVGQTTRRISSATGMALGMAGSDDVIITSTRSEPTTQKGTFINPVYLSTDGGATWNIDYFRESDSHLNGFTGVIGPNRSGDFFLSYGWTRGLKKPDATVRARRKQGKKLMGSPLVNTNKIEVINLSVLNEPLTSNLSKIVKFDKLLPYDVLNAGFYITNTYGESIELSFVRNGLPISNLEGLESKTVIQGNKQVYMTAKDLGMSNLNKTTELKITAGALTTGKLSIELVGEQLVPSDVRLM